MNHQSRSIDSVSKKEDVSSNQFDALCSNVSLMWQGKTFTPPERLQSSDLISKICNLDHVFGAPDPDLHFGVCKYPEHVEKFRNGVNECISDVLDALRNNIATSSWWPKQVERARLMSEQTAEQFDRALNLVGFAIFKVTSPYAVKNGEGPYYLSFRRALDAAFTDNASLHIDHAADEDTRTQVFLEKLLGAFRTFRDGIQTATSKELELGARGEKMLSAIISLTLDIEAAKEEFYEGRAPVLRAIVEKLRVKSSFGTDGAEVGNVVVEATEASAMPRRFQVCLHYDGEKLRSTDWGKLGLERPTDWKLLSSAHSEEVRFEEGQTKAVVELPKPMQLMAKHGLLKTEVSLLPLGERLLDPLIAGLGLGLPRWGSQLPI